MVFEEYYPALLGAVILGIIWLLTNVYLRSTTTASTSSSSSKIDDGNSSKQPRSEVDEHHHGVEELQPPLHHSTNGDNGEAGDATGKAIPAIEPKVKSNGNLPDIAAAGSMTQFVVGLHKKFGPVAGFWMKETFLVSIAGPELLGQVIHLFDRPTILFENFIPLIGAESVQFACGEDGQQRRKMMDRSFSHEKLSKKISLFQEIGEELCSQWTKAAQTCEHIPLTIDSTAIVMKALTRYAFGDYFKNKDDFIAFRKDYDHMFWLLENIIVDGPIEPGSEREKECNEGIARMQRVVQEIIRQRQQTEVDPEDKIFIDTLLDTYDNEDRLFSDCLTFLIGGSHTTGFLVFWMLYHLANHPDMQERCYEEICEHYSGGPITFDTIKKLKYMHCVMNETHRCTNLGPFAARYSTKDMTLGGYRVPAETPIMLSLYALHHDESRWPEPQRFDPERFADQGKMESFAFEPFGIGKRKCPGYRMTDMEVPTFLILILKKFKVSLVAGQKVGHKYGILTKPDCEVYITVESRE